MTMAALIDSGLQVNAGNSDEAWSDALVKTVTALVVPEAA